MLIYLSSCRSAMFQALGVICVLACSLSWFATLKTAFKFSSAYNRKISFSLVVRNASALKSSKGSTFNAAAILTRLLGETQA